MPPWIYTVLDRRWFRIGERNGGSDFKTAARVCRVSAQNQPAQLRFFSFPIGRGRLSSYIEIKEPIITSEFTFAYYRLCVCASGSWLYVPAYIAHAGVSTPAVPLCQRLYLAVDFEFRAAFVWD